MNATFDYLSTAAGPTGYSADKGRLVQAWAWYSLADRTFNGWLYDPQTGARSAYGDNFAAYTAPDHARSQSSAHSRLGRASHHYRRPAGR